MSTNRQWGLRLVAGLAVLAVLGGCGGGTGRDDTGSSGSGSGDVSRSTYANRCSPDNTLAHTSGGALKAGYLSGSLSQERAWVRAMMTADYLWFSEIPAADESLAQFNVTPAEVALDNWFEALKTPAITASGKRKDAYSFTISTDEWNALVQSGVVYGYGMELLVYAATVPRDVRVAYTQPSSRAATAGVLRGDRILSITTGGRTIDAVNTTDSTEIALLNEALFSPSVGQIVSFRLQAVGGTDRTVTMTAGSVTTQPVLSSQIIPGANGGQIGHIVFNDFILPAEGQLRTVFQQFANQGVNDLVLDLRYNGGGYIYIASQLAYMVAPTSSTSGKTFERFLYSSKRAADTASTSNRTNFRSTTTGQSGTGTSSGSALPNLALNRVFVLTSPNTCSASESVINGLRGVDVEVILVGGSTCGKPYGFTAKDNCGLSYFPVEFQGVNEKGFGDFADGFAPTCAVADDLTRPLGDVNEGMLRAALLLRDGATCASVSVAAKSVAGSATTSSTAARGSGQLLRSPARAGKFIDGSM